MIIMYSLYHFNFIIIFLKTYRKWFVNEKLFRNPFERLSFLINSDNGDSIII